MSSVDWASIVQQKSDTIDQGNLNEVSKINTTDGDALQKITQFGIKSNIGEAIKTGVQTGAKNSMEAIKQAASALR